MTDRIMLGAAQLGMPYGAVRRTALPTEEDSVALLDAAWRLGVRWFDTAPLYGESEDRIGAWRVRRRLTPLLCTKIPPFPPAEVTTPEDHLRRSLTESAARLGAERLDAVMLHRADDLLRDEVVEAVNRRDLTDAAVRFGVSVYTPDQLEVAEGRLTRLEIIQTPANLLDRRFTPALIRLRKRTKPPLTVARSVFLQGVLLHDEDAVRARLPGAAEAVGAVARIAAEARLPRAALLLRHALTRLPHDMLVIGAGSAVELSETLDLLSDADARIEQGCRALDALSLEAPPGVLDPRLWPKAPQPAK